MVRRETDYTFSSYMGGGCFLFVYRGFDSLPRGQANALPLFLCPYVSFPSEHMQVG